MKTSYIVATIIFMVLLVASPVYLLSGNNQLRPVGSKAYWRALAADAWEYFQPGKGVNAQTGLHGAGLGYPYFTEWDLGTHIQAIIDAKELGLLQKDGQWGFDYRIEKILDFLRTRKQASNGLPYLWYDSVTGEPYGDTVTFDIDEGKLYMALYNLKLVRPDLAPDIDYIVKVRNNNTILLADPKMWLESTDFYCYYVANAFKSFGFEGWDVVPSSIIDTIVSQATVSAYGVELPVAHISSEPLLLSFFEINPQEPKFDWLLSQVNLAQEARYNATGHYTAFSEGNTALNDPTYVYEYVVDNDGSTFKVAPDTTPIAYLKVAVGFDAIFNTNYTRNAVKYIKGKLPTSSSGFQDGVAEDGREVNTIIDRTNGLIISAARYVIENGDFGVSSWQHYNMSSFPWPFVRGEVANNISVVVGESQPHNPVGAAQTIDVIGGMLITEMLGRESSNGTLNAAIDSWLVKYDSNSGGATLLDNTTNIIIVGSPRINALSYYFNGLRDQFDESLVPVQYAISDESYSYLYVPNSGSIYKTEFDEQGKIIADYGVIMSFQDQLNRYVVLVYGLESEATLGACQVLRDYRQWGLHGSATILKFYIDRPGNFPSNSSIVEVVP